MFAGTQVVREYYLIFGISRNKFLTKKFFHQSGYEGVYLHILKSLSSTPAGKPVTAAGR